MKIAHDGESRILIVELTEDELAVFAKYDTLATTVTYARELSLRTGDSTYEANFPGGERLSVEVSARKPEGNNANNGNWQT